MKAVIIEDELNSQELLQIMLKEFCDDVEVSGFADSVSSGVQLIDDTNPDLVFLDVEIREGTGFEILKNFENPTFKVIVITGYDHYAIKAIKYSAIDYILKPINVDELTNAVSKVRESLNIDESDKIRYLKKNYNKPESDLDHFILSDRKEARVLRFEDIVFVEAGRAYASFQMSDGQKYTATKPLRFYETILPETLFFRIHKSYLINIKKVVNVPVGRKSDVEILGGFKLPIAYRRKPSFIKLLKDIRS